MNERAGERGERVFLWRWAVVLAVLFVALAAFAVLVGAFGHPASLLPAIVFAECACIPVVVLVAAGCWDPRSVGVVRFVTREAAACGAAAAVGTLVVVGAALFRGAGPPGGALVAQLVVLAFGVLLGAVLAAARAAGAGRLAAQCAAVLAAAALLGTVFYADPVIESERSPESRQAVISAVLAVNPLTATCGVLRFDLMRRQLMYDHISVIGRYYQVTYPQRWWTTPSGYLAAAVLLAGAAWACECVRIRRFRKGVSR